MMLVLCLKMSGDVIYEDVLKSGNVMISGHVMILADVMMLEKL